MAIEPPAYHTLNLADIVTELEALEWTPEVSKALASAQDLMWALSIIKAANPIV